MPFRFLSRIIWIFLFNQVFKVGKRFFGLLFPKKSPSIGGLALQIFELKFILCYLLDLFVFKWKTR